MKYEKPISEIKEFECVDVVTTSGGNNGSLDNGNEFAGGGEYGF